mgnify:FL=1
MRVSASVRDRGGSRRVVVRGEALDEGDEVADLVDAHTACTLRHLPEVVEAGGEDLDPGSAMDHFELHLVAQHADQSEHTILVTVPHSNVTLGAHRGEHLAVRALTVADSVAGPERVTDCDRDLEERVGVPDGGREVGIAHHVPDLAVFGVASRRDAGVTLQLLSPEVGGPTRRVHTLEGDGDAQEGKEGQREKVQGSTPNGVVQHAGRDYPDHQ